MNVGYICLGTGVALLGLGIASIYPATSRWMFEKSVSAMEYYLQAKRYLGFEAPPKIVSPAVRRRLIDDIRKL